MHITLIIDSEKEEISAKTIKFPSPIPDDYITVKDRRSDILDKGSYDLELHRRSKRADGADQQFDPTQVVDNLKIYNYAKTDFSDRNVE